MTNEQITVTLSREEFITLWNCVWSEIGQREHEWDKFKEQPITQLLIRLYALEAKLKELHTPKEAQR